MKINNSKTFLQTFLRYDIIFVKISNLKEKPLVKIIENICMKKFVEIKKNLPCTG